jgi:transposase
MATPTTPTRKAYPSDVRDEEWAFVAPYLCLLPETAGQRKYPLREVFNGLRYLVKTGGQWRWLPHDLPPWPVVYQQARRWLAAGCFEAILHDLCALLRVAQGRAPEPTAALFDSQTLQSTPESGGHGGYDGAKRKRGSKVHLAVDTLGDLLALRATPADVQDRAQVATLATAVQEATGETVEITYADQGYTGPQAEADAATQGIRLVVVKHPAGSRGFLLLPKRWIVERAFAWKTRFRRLVRDYERTLTVLTGLHLVAFACLELARAVPALWLW